MRVGAEVTLVDVLLTSRALEAGGAGTRVWGHTPAPVVTGRITNSWKNSCFKRYIKFIKINALISGSVRFIEC